MNRREITVNTLLGLLLLLAFAIPVVVLVIAVGFALQAVDLFVAHSLPQLVHSWDVEFYGFLCLWSLISGVGHLRKRRWTSAFLSFAIIPTIISTWFSVVRSPLGNQGIFLWPWCLIIFNSSDSVLTRLEFMLSSLFVSAGIAVNSSLLGSGALARATSWMVLVGVFTLFVIQWRRQIERNGLQPASTIQA